MESTTIQQAHSAEVRLRLEVDGHNLGLAQTGPEHIIVRQPIDLPPCHAEIVMTIDGREHRRRVRLVDGISKDNRLVRTVEVD